MAFMKTADHILVVDDDSEIRSLLEEFLTKNEFRVTTAKDGKEMRSALELGNIDLVVLDVMLPGESGLQLCQALRLKEDLPVIMLTALGTETDRIAGLEIGADDYLSKPFNPRELLARIRVILRRANSLPRNLRPDLARFVRFAGWCLDTRTRNLTSPSGTLTPLSGAEYRLLRVLLDHHNRVVSRDQLTDLLLGRESDPFDRSIDVQVSRLRRRLGDQAREPDLIKTVRNEGYVLAAVVELEH